MGGGEARKVFCSLSFIVPRIIDDKGIIKKKSRMKVYQCNGGTMHKLYFYILHTIEVQVWNRVKASKKLSHILHMDSFLIT